MRNLKVLWAVAVSALLAAAALAQFPTPVYYQNGQYSAYAFGQYRLPVYTPVAAAGSATITIQTTGAALPGGPSFEPIASNTPIYVQDGSNSEIVSPNAVSCSAGSCSFTGTFANAHLGNFFVTSGTFGLQEAIDWAYQKGGGIVSIGPDWQAAAQAGSGATGGTTPDGVVEAAAGYYNVSVADSRVTTSTNNQFVWTPTSVTQISAPTAPVLTKIAGSMTSGTYYASGECVDARGGISLPSTSNNSVTTATGISVATPVGCSAANGAVGWLPLVTAASGSDGTEILAAEPITSSICTLSTLESVTPACAIGVAASITANPSSTSKEVVESTAFSTWGYLPTNAPVMPFVKNYALGVFAAGGTLNISNEDLAQFQVPAGFLNSIGKGFRVCVKGKTATEVAASTLTIKLTAANSYAQSPVTVASLAFPTQTQAAAGTQQGCVDVLTATTGASGKVFAQVPAPWSNAANAAPTTIVQAQDVSAAASSAINLTKETYWAVNFAEGTGDNVTAPGVNQLVITPLQ